MGTHFLVRTCVDRLAGDGSSTIGQGDEGRSAFKACTAYRSETRKASCPRRAEIRYCRLVVLPPLAAEKLPETDSHRDPRSRTRAGRRDGTESTGNCSRPAGVFAQEAVEKLVWYPCDGRSRPST